MEYTKQQIKLARRFLRRYKTRNPKRYMMPGKKRRDKYLIKRARYSLKIVNWAKQKGLNGPLNK